MAYNPDNLHKILWPIERIPKTNDNFREEDLFMWALGHIAFYAARAEDSIKLSLGHIFKSEDASFYNTHVQSRSLNHLLVPYKETCLLIFPKQQKELNDLFKKAREAAQERNTWLHTAISVRASTGEVMASSLRTPEQDKRLEINELISLANRLYEIAFLLSSLSMQVINNYDILSPDHRRQIRISITNKNSKKKPGK